MIISAHIGLSLAVTVAVNVEMVPVRDQGKLKSNECLPAEGTGAALTYRISAHPMGSAQLKLLRFPCFYKEPQASVIGPHRHSTASGDLLRGELGGVQAV